MRLILVSLVTILTCSVQVLGSTTANGYKYDYFRRRQARQMATSQPSPSACDRSPCLNGATCEWMDVPITCDCAVGFTGPVCEIDIDECASSPCTNNGYMSRCVDYINGYECECPVGFGGSECSVELNECDSDPCQNNGHCRDRFNGFTCLCTRGFTGTLCEININECRSFPCQNQGRCIDGVNTFTCECRFGFNGQLCESAVLQVYGCVAMPCRNGGRCIDVQGGFRCACARGFHGRTCSQYSVRSQCHMFPCMNGGRCIEQRQGYTCHCHHGYTGFNCETATGLVTNGCAQRPCRNGGRCNNLVNGFICTCPSGFTGKRCEREIGKCSHSNCLNGGVCESDREFTYCICPGGYSGRICQFHEQDFLVRLVGGELENEGRVEVYYKNKWGPISDGEWTLEDASAVCHHLGYHSATDAFSHSEYGNSNDPAQICEMMCTGNEHVIHDCALDQPAAGVGCKHKGHVGVICTDLQSPCPVSWRSLGSSCYYVDPKPRTWEEARKTCQKTGARLAQIASEHENEFLRDYLETNHGGYSAAWIGLSDVTKEGTWSWLGLKNSSFYKWNIGEPNNGGMTSMIRTSNSVMMSTTNNGQNCVEMLSINGKWNDIECSLKRSSVCETVQETMSSVKKLSAGLIAVITVIVIVFIVGGVVTACLVLT